MKTLEQRIGRAERVLKMFVRAGRKYRKGFREDIETLIHTQMRDNDEWRARHRAMDEKINILIDAQIATDEQLKRTDQQIEALSASQAKTERALDRLTANQAKTEHALDRLTANQAKTEQALDRLTASQAKTEQALDRLTASQARTDEALNRFLNGLNKGRNGNSSD